MAVKAVRSLKPMALSPVAKAIIGRKIWGTEAPIEAVNQPPVVSGAINLGSVDVGAGLVVSTNDLLTGATDPDGDTLTVSGLTVTTGSATITGSGPWTITPSAAGSVVISYTISDGNGGSVAQTASIVATVVSATPSISSVTGTVAHGQTITVTGSGLGQSPTLLRISGDEGAAGTSVATATGMTVHGSTGNEWLFESGGTMVLDMQAEQPKTVYKVFGTTTPELFAYYEAQHFDIGPVNLDGNGQIKEMRANEASDGSHSTSMIVGTIWQRESSLQQFMEGTSSDIEERALTVANAGDWKTTTIGGVISGGQVTASIEQYGGGGNYKYEGPPIATVHTGFGQVFLPFYKTDGFAISSRMRNLIVRDGKQGLVVANNADPAFWTNKVEQDASDASSTSATIKLDLQRFTGTDSLYLFARNAAGELSAPHLLYAPPVDTYDPLTDDYGLIRARLGAVDLPDYSIAASAADSIEYQIGFRIDALDSYTAGTPIGICLTKHSSAGSQFRGLLRIDHVTGNVTLTSMANNTTLTLASGTDFHTTLGVRRDWKLIIPKATNSTIELRNASDNTLIGSATRSATFDGWWPQRWMFNNNLAAQGAINGRLFYQRAFATTGGVTAPLFDLRYTLAQSGLTSVPSAHDSEFLATLASGITWGAE